MEIKRKNQRKLTRAVVAMEDVPGGGLPAAGVVDRIRQVAVQGREGGPREELPFDLLDKDATAIAVPHQSGACNVELGTQVRHLGAVGAVLHARSFALTSIIFPSRLHHMEALLAAKGCKRDHACSGSQQGLIGLIDLF